MKKVSGMSFGVRFYRRAAPKSAAKEKPQDENGEEAMKDIPEQKPQAAAPQEPSGKPATVFRPAKIAKEWMLREAAMTGDCYIIRNLVMDGVDLDARDASGRTALNIATQYNRKEAIKTLLAAREMRRMAQTGELPDTGFYGRFKQKTAD
jgi:hypothetical protein